MDIEKKLHELRIFIGKHGLFGAKEKILLAISGGVDSVVMGRLMVALGQPFGVVHCNFKLRGEASDGDEAFVKQLANEWKVQFFSTSFDTIAFAEENGLSIQMAARELRYGYFSTLSAQQGNAKIATAHHVNDALETILLNLTHGTGFRGLSGITPARDHFVRPMLAFTGEEIREIAGALALKWREDASNAKDDYERNKLRHRVVPVLEELNPSLGATLKDTLVRLWTTDAAIKGGLEVWQASHVVEKEGYTEVALKGAGEHLMFYLYEYLKAKTSLPYKSFKQLEASIGEGTSGKLFFTDTHQINLDRGRLIISRTGEDEGEEPIFVDANDKEVVFQFGKLSCQTLAMPVAIDRSEGVALLDADCLRFPLELRRWREGDSFVPLGMSGQKKISDFMIDAKIPVNLKSRVYVLLSGGEVVWVVGKRIDDRCKITAATSRVYKLSVC
ncbi:MAG: tRNA lysidine(34) synthetase TilS [Imperialibacter sp.]|uniref:tRNA lysidine(34) synthetase TilS n=1 Tax=Imperialibacter sp. TaxID=2038411 RepID=UPI003A83BFDD